LAIFIPGVKLSMGRFLWQLSSQVSRVCHGDGSFGNFHPKCQSAIVMETVSFVRGRFRLQSLSLLSQEPSPVTQGTR
jgi:hypothetical protein